MSKINLKSELFQRLCIGDIIRFEIANNKVYGVTSNGQIGVVEYIGTTDQVDSVCHVKITETLTSAVGDSFILDGSVEVYFESEIAIGEVTVDNNYKEQDCFDWSDESVLDDWRKWFTLANENNGFMYWNIYELEKLFKTSTRGNIVWPEIIDSTKPLVLNDIDNDNWMGVFIPLADVKTKINPANVKEWL